MSNIEQRVTETLERVVRLESRLVQLGDYVGANLRSRQRIIVHPERSIEGDPLAQRAYVEIDSLDVSASRILTELRQAGVKASEVEVQCNGHRVFTLYPPATTNHQG